jgi:hypothetical protein
MNIFEGSGLEEYTPWRAKLGLRSKPQYLRFLSLDNFDIDRSSLKKHHIDLLDNIVVRTVEASWRSMQPIGLIRLIGHTDSTGPEKYNVGLRPARSCRTRRAKGQAKRIHQSIGDCRGTKSGRNRADGRQSYVGR